ncbi:hypothetical protein ACCO45_009232 [Purpureocillium lilacinum]|uniref:Uncharacterized protein n=1 Tax=Purpureocillium lilacinum TaxID=33203 RepID=A0ACC4DJ33_PURLI
MPAMLLPAGESAGAQAYPYRIARPGSLGAIASPERITGRPASCSGGHTKDGSRPGTQRRVGESGGASDAVSGLARTNLVAVVARIGIRGSMQPSRPIQSVPSCLVRMLSMRQVLAHAQVKTWPRRCGLQPVLRASTSTDNTSRLGPRSVEARPVAKPHRDAYQVGRRQAQRHGVPASPHNKFFCVFLLWFGRRRTGGRLGPDPRTIGAIVTAVTTASRPEMGRRTAPGRGRDGISMRPILIALLVRVPGRASTHVEISASPALPHAA